MARSRNIKPSLFKNEILGEADPLLTILFTGLWCLADREGRLEDRPRRIRAEIFPYREGLDIESMLNFLADESFIHRYQIENESFIQVAKFHEHQSPHHMEAESVIPPMPGGVNKLNAKPLYKKQRERILERDGHECVKCGSTKKLHIDHIHPVILGGTSDDENLQVLCEKCNTSKGGRIVHESSTNRPRIVENVSIPLIPDSLFTDSLNNPSTPKKAGVIVDIPGWIDSELWQEFEKHRKEIKAKLTPTATKALIAKLDKYRLEGADPNEALRESIANGWRGVFPEKTLEKTNGKTQHRTGETAVQRREREARDAIERADRGYARIY